MDYITIGVVGMAQKTDPKSKIKYFWDLIDF